MIEKLIDLITAGWDIVSPFDLVEAYNHDVVLRWGRAHRTLAPGFHWKIPFAERAVSVMTCETTLRLAPQTLTTKDDACVVVTAIVRYQIRQPEAYVTQIWDQQDVLADVSMGAVRAAVGAVNYADLVAEPPERAVLDEVRKRVNKYGFQIHAITFTDLGRVRSLRIILPAPKDIAN